MLLSQNERHGFLIQQNSKTDPVLILQKKNDNKNNNKNWSGCGGGGGGGTKKNWESVTEIHSRRKEINCTKSKSVKGGKENKEFS